MSNIDIILPEKAADIGNFLVGRLLPFRQKRSVGPFVFIDHMGPTHMKDTDNLEVPPHPHIGLSTLTYLFEGAIMHRDSLGNAMEITPGAVNWMTAGKGVTHSERTPESLRHMDKYMHGLQIWIAMPKDQEDIEPNFAHFDAESIPSWEEKGVTFKLIAGQIGEHISPVPVYSKLYMLELKSQDTVTVNLVNQLYGESGLYIVHGKIKNQEIEYEPGFLLITKDAHLCTFEMEANTTVYIFGGEPFPEERFIYWNFVSSSKEKIEKAKEDWKNHRFPLVPNDDGYVPLPGN